MTSGCFAYFSLFLIFFCSVAKWHSDDNEAHDSQIKKIKNQSSYTYKKWKKNAKYKPKLLLPLNGKFNSI